MDVGHSWNWDRVTTAFWSEPSEDVYYLLHRWRKSGFERVLDLGCGMGRHSLLLAEHGFQVVALDASESGLQKLEASAAERGLTIERVQADLTNLPFGDESFDAVLAYHSIYHVDSRGMAAAVAELYRVMKPGAEVYLTLNSKTNPTYSDPRNRVVDSNVRMKPEEDGTILPHFYCGLDDIRNLFSRFRIIRLRQMEDIHDDRSSWHYFMLAARGESV
jgi:SAM-dependent methyltransferase